MQNILQNLAGVQGGDPPEGGPIFVECSACCIFVYFFCILNYNDMIKGGGGTP